MSWSDSVRPPSLLLSTPTASRERGRVGIISWLRLIENQTSRKRKLGENVVLDFLFCLFLLSICRLFLCCLLFFFHTHRTSVCVCSVFGGNSPFYHRTLGRDRAKEKTDSRLLFVSEKKTLFLFKCFVYSNSAMFLCGFRSMCVYLL